MWLTKTGGLTLYVTAKKHGMHALPRPVRQHGTRVAGLLALVMSALPMAHADAVDDYLMRERAVRQIPGMELAVVRHGQITRISAYGTANLETDTPVTPDSVFPIASLDKAVTASGVLKAAELGKLQVDDLIPKYVDVPFPGVTLAMLLSHTSGLPDMGVVLAQRYGSRTSQHYTTAELLDAVRSAALDAGPNVQCAYSDAGLFLAQLATQQAVGQRWFEFMQEVLFHPSGMQHVVTFDPHAVIPNRVSGYTFDDAQHLIRDDRTDVQYGELYNDIGMTIGDFARWVIMLDGRGQLSPASVTRMMTPTILGDGTVAQAVFPFSDYGLGVGLDELLGHPMWLHTGSSGVAWIKIPDLDVAVVVFTNLAHSKGSDPAGLAIAVAGLLEPQLSLRKLPTARGPLPAAGRALRKDYELFYAGTPNLQRYTPHARRLMWQNRRTFFSGRSPRLGALKDWQFLRSTVIEGKDSYQYRATHEHGEIYVRFSLTRDGLIEHLVWWHL